MYVLHSHSSAADHKVQLARCLGGRGQRVRRLLPLGIFVTRGRTKSRAGDHERGRLCHSSATAAGALTETPAGHPARVAAAHPWCRCEDIEKAHPVPRSCWPKMRHDRDRPGCLPVRSVLLRRSSPLIEPSQQTRVALELALCFRGVGTLCTKFACPNGNQNTERTNCTPVRVGANPAAAYSHMLGAHLAAAGCELKMPGD